MPFKNGLCTILMNRRWVYYDKRFEVSAWLEILLQIASTEIFAGYDKTGIGWRHFRFHFPLSNMCWRRRVAGSAFTWIQVSALPPGFDAFLFFMCWTAFPSLFYREEGTLFSAFSFVDSVSLERVDREKCVHYFYATKWSMGTEFFDTQLIPEAPWVSVNATN